MSKPCKIVTLPEDFRDVYRQLINNVKDAEQKLSAFEKKIKAAYGPETRSYAPFERVQQEFLDTPLNPDGSGGNVHVYFTKELGHS